MKQWTFILVVALWVVSVPTSSGAQENAHRFVAAIEAYKNQDYAAAIREMEQIAQSGVRNGALFYNLGNAYLKDNRLGHAVLWYERALQLLPNDPDLRFNAAYAKSLTRDASDDNTVSPMHVLFFWKYRLSNRTIIFVAAAFNLLFWCALIGWRLTVRRNWRYASMVLAVPSVIFIFTAAFNYYEATHPRQGIVVDEQVSVRSGLESTSTELFVLHAGTRIKIVKKKAHHIQIRFGKDKIGWVGTAAIGLI